MFKKKPGLRQSLLPASPTGGGKSSHHLFITPAFHHSPRPCGRRLSHRSFRTGFFWSGSRQHYVCRRTQLEEEERYRFADCSAVPFDVGYRYTVRWRQHPTFWRRRKDIASRITPRFHSMSGTDTPFVGVNTRHSGGGGKISFRGLLRGSIRCRVPIHRSLASTPDILEEEERDYRCPTVWPAIFHPSCHSQRISH
jgi:hypothetical protein